MKKQKNTTPNALVLVAIGLSFALAAHAQQASLPASVQEDLLRERILNDVKSYNVDDTLKAIDDYKGLGVPVPLPLLFVEAKAAHKIGDHLRAFQALEKFLSASDRSSPAYHEAIALYPTYQNSAQPLLQAEEAKQKKAAAEAATALAAAQAENERNKEAAVARGSALAKEIESQLVAIPARSCRLGATGLYRKIPTTSHGVYQLTSISVQKVPVTADQYAAYIQATGRENQSFPKPRKGSPNFATEVTHSDALAFIQWLNGRGSRRYRLLTADEYECLSLNVKLSPMTIVKQFGAENSFVADADSDRFGVGESLEGVGTHTPTNDGIHDLWVQAEWTSSCAQLDSPAGATDCSKRVTPGGGYTLFTFVSRAAMFSVDDKDRFAFRVVTDTGQR